MPKYAGRVSAFKIPQGSIDLRFVHEGQVSEFALEFEGKPFCFEPNRSFQDLLLLTLGSPKGCEDKFLHDRVRFAARDLTLGYEPCTIWLDESLEWTGCLDTGRSEISLTVRFDLQSMQVTIASKLASVFRDE